MDQMTELEDGSVIVTAPEEEEPQEVAFDANLVETTDPMTLGKIALDLLDAIDRDKVGQEKKDKKYAEGIRRTGLGDKGSSESAFEGSSTVVHPVLAESCVDYAASAIKALFPSDGPVKMHQVNRGAKADFDRAERKRDLMNWQLTKQIPEYRADLEVLLSQQPLSGAQYLKWWHDRARNRPACEFVPADRVYLPYGANSFASASRRTIVVPLDSLEFTKRLETGMYVGENLTEPALPDTSETQEVADSVSGIEEPGYNEDGLRIVFEVYTYLGLDDDEILKPYIISIDEHSQKIIGLYRNWEENDPLFEELPWVVEFPFIPWRSTGGIGLAHLIGDLSDSATGALRALLDAAHLSNIQGGVRLKGGRTSGKTAQFSMTEFTEVDFGPGMDDIRKVVMPWPFQGPNQVMLQLLGLLVDTAKGVVSTAEEKIKDVGNNTPVGTTMALIEQGAKVFSSIHLRLHSAQAECLEILQRINATYPSDEHQMKKFGRVIVSAEEFRITDDIVPVSDPNIFSETQRFAQLQGLQQLAADQTVPWNRIEIYHRMMRLMRVDNPEDVLPKPPEPISGAPTDEIVAAMSGKQIQAQQGMPHLQHILQELEFVLDPVFGGGNPTNMNPGFQVIMADVKQHMLFLYAEMRQRSEQAAGQQVTTRFLNTVGTAVAPQMVQQLLTQWIQTPQGMQQVQTLAKQLFEREREGLAMVVQMMQAADELVKQRTPQPPPDPAVAAQLQIAQMEVQRKTQLDQATLNLKQQEQQVENQLKGAHLQLAQQEQQFNQMLAQSSQQLEAAAKQLAQQVEIQKNDDDNRQHQMTELLKNHEDNQTALLMEQMRQQGLELRQDTQNALKEYQIPRTP